MILVIKFLLIISINGQVIYDTIPKLEEELIGTPEEFVIIKDFDRQLKQIKYPDTLQVEGRVIVSTIFGKNGVLKDTKVIKSLNPVCDSIAFYGILSLKDWLPAMTRGKFVDMPFSIPIYFKREDLIKQKGTQLLFSATEKEYEKRKQIFDFVYSEDSEIITEK